MKPIYRKLILAMTSMSFGIALHQQDWQSMLWALLVICLCMTGIESAPAPTEPKE